MMRAFLSRHWAPLALTSAGLGVVLGLQAPGPTHEIQADLQGLTYQTPPQVIVDLVDAPQPPEVSLDPQRKWMLLMDPAGLPSIGELAQPELRIAGLRIHPRNNGQSRPRSTFAGLTLKRLSDGSEVKLEGLPPGPLRIRHVTWSPDGRQIAFALVRETAIELWDAETASGRCRRLSDARLNDAVRGSPFFWLSDSQTLVCKLVPDERGPTPEQPRVPTGPVIQENLGKKAPARTYQDLLKSPYDEALFEFFLTARIARIGLDGGVTPIGEKGLFRQARPSPNGKYILVESIQRPFSYLVPYYRFPNRVQVWDLEGRLVRQIADVALAEEVPISFDAVPPGPRSFGWRADAPATLYWTAAADDGDPRKPARVRDRLYTLPAPFTGEPTPLIDLGLRFTEIAWGNPHLALVSERWRKDRRLRTWMVQPDAPGAEPVLLFDRSYEDRYSDPGRPVLRPTSSGPSVLLTANGGRTIFLTGEGASPEGNRPFLDRFNLSSREAKRLWRSAAPYYEAPVELLDTEGKLLLTRRESKTEPPNYFRRDLTKDRIEPLSTFADPAPQLAGAKKELIRYERDDGVQLTATLYLPPGYAPGERPLPLLMWAYPREYKSAAAAAQVRDSPYRFYRLRPGTHLYFLALGYAILDGPTMPIIGEGDKEPNDTYVEQLVSSAKAAVDEVVRRGVADRDRIAIGGHSYGAFMTANLLAHSDLFRAGIARSGAYNRTLTPFGFQAEQRTFWQAPEVYFKMSPFMHADKVNEPLLLIHGMADNNSGTFPIQSRRMYHALKGHGAVARLVMLPHESHGYRGRESILHVYWEMNRWLEKYVKNAPARPSSSE